MSDHSFNPFLAKKFGLIESILIKTLIFWTQTNSAKNENFREDRYWCFGTPDYFTKFFMYLTPRQIQYALKKLTDAGAIIKGNFNKKKYDKTNWYSLSDSLLFELNLDKTCLQPASALIGQNCLMHQTKLFDASDKIVEPIPDTKKDTKQDNKQTNCKPKSSSSFFFSETLDKEMLLQRLEKDTRSDKEFLTQVKEHVLHHSDKKFMPMRRAQAALKLLQKLNGLNIIFYVAGKEPKNNPQAFSEPIATENPHFTPDELILLSDIKIGIKLNKPELRFSGQSERFKAAQAVYDKEQELIKSCQTQNYLPNNNARRNCLTSASELVLHLA